VNKKAIYALMLAALLPLISYLLVKNYSDTAVTMPRHYLPDSVINTVSKGKSITDTIWHKLPEFSLTNQQGQTVGWKDLTYKDEERNEIDGKVVVADFFFTHCPTICPALTRNMKRLQESINNAQRVGDKTPEFVHFLSFSIDPERDSVSQLKHWADRYQINPEQWWLLTGEKRAIYDLAINDMKVGLVDGHGIDTSFLHTDYFVLIDQKRQVRGYYRGLDTMEIKRLASDVVLLSMEKDPQKKGILAGKLEIMAIAFFAAIAGVTILLFILRKKKNVSPTLEKK
jgi:protein SCO1